MALFAFSTLKGCVLQALDGELGNARDLLFDDSTWEIRYLIARTGTWLSRRKVLLSPVALAPPLADSRLVPVSLTREQIRNSPDIDTDKPVSRQMQEQLAAYYQWPALQTYSYWPTGTFVPPPVPELPDAIPQPEPPPEGPQLRSCRELIGYSLAARDGEIGEAKDFIVDTEGWKIALLVVDTGNWLPGRKVLLSPSFVTRISWSERSVSVTLARDQVQGSPQYDRDTELNEEYVRSVLDYYAETE